MPSNPDPGPEHINELHLVGRLAAEPQERTLPSGDTVVSFRVVVRRSARERREGSPVIDALECSAWGATQRRTVLRWLPGDVVEVVGRVRRRFQRSLVGPTSRWDVEVLTAKRVQRAADAERVAVPGG